MKPKTERQTGCPEEIIAKLQSRISSQNELIKEAVGSIDWIGQTLHRAHHEGEFSKCEKNTCDHANKFVAKLRESVKGEG